MTTYVWSIDDAGSGGSKMVESMDRMTEFFDSRNLKSTWLVVPKPDGHPLSTEWKDAIKAAHDGGHDIQLHGLTHEDCYEFGPPAWPAITIGPTMQAIYDKDEAEFQKRYTVENLQARIEEGLEIFDQELDIHPTLFRAPCGAISKPMFQALQNVGIRYHTVMYISGTGYQHLPHNSGSLEPVWTDEIPHRPFRWYNDIIEAPILGEYTWRGSGKRSEEFIELAKRDVDRIAEESPIAVILMHTHGIADDYEHTFRLVDAVVEHVENQGGDFSTLGELIESGALDDAAISTGPDLLAI